MLPSYDAESLGRVSFYEALGRMGGVVVLKPFAAGADALLPATGAGKEAFAEMTV